jgi:hypothetical protein
LECLLLLASSWCICGAVEAAKNVCVVHLASYAELLEGHEDGSDDELDAPGSGSEEGEGMEEHDDEDGQPGDLADLDYDALLAAGAAQHAKLRGAEDSDGGSEEEEDGGERQLAGRKRKRGAAARAAVEDDYFKLGEAQAGGRPRPAVCGGGCLLNSPQAAERFVAAACADEMEAFVQQAEREEAGLEDGALPWSRRDVCFRHGCTWLPASCYACQLPVLNVCALAGEGGDGPGSDDEGGGWQFQQPPAHVTCRKVFVT